MRVATRIAYASVQRYWPLATIILVLATLTRAQTADGTKVGPGWHQVGCKIIDTDVLLEISVNDMEPRWFVVDTGAPTTLIDRKAASDLLLDRDLLPSTRASPQFNIPKNIRFKIGPCLIQTTASVRSLEAFSRVVGVDVAGIVGNNVLSKVVLQIQYDRRCAFVTEPQSFSYTGQGDVIPILVRDYLWALALVKNDAGEDAGVYLTVDTGGSVALELTTAIANTLHLDIPDSNGTIQMNYLTGPPQTFRRSSVACLTIGRSAVFRVPTLVAPEGSPLEKGQRDGLIGGKILERFTVILDYCHRRLILEPNTNHARSFQTWRYGLGLFGAGDRFEVITVLDVELGSAAAEAGLKKGDVIVAAAEVGEGSLTMARMYQLLREPPNGVVHLVVQRAGNRMNVDLRPRSSE